MFFGIPLPPCPLRVACYFSAVMSITVIVENDTIKLPAHVHVPDGTRLEITLPGKAAGAGVPARRFDATAHRAWMQRTWGDRVFADGEAGEVRAAQERVFGA